MKSRHLYLRYEFNMLFCNSYLLSGVPASPVALFPQTRNFTLLCLSSSKCINGYLRHTGGGVTLPQTRILSRGGEGGGVAILLGMLHAKETGISFKRLGLWLVCAFILTYFVSWYMLLISTVIKTNARHYVRCLNTCTLQLFLSLFCRFMSSN